MKNAKEFESFINGPKNSFIAQIEDYIPSKNGLDKDINVKVNLHKTIKKGEAKGVHILGIPVTFVDVISDQIKFQ
jgi:hypothetical protein